jgi:hypothetical protein
MQNRNSKTWKIKLNHRGNLGAGRKLILRHITRMQGVTIWTWLIYLNIGSSGLFFWTHKWKLRFHRRRPISWPADWILAFQELCSMERVTYQIEWNVTSGYCGIYYISFNITKEINCIHRQLNLTHSTRSDVLKHTPDTPRARSITCTKREQIAEICYSRVCINIRLAKLIFVCINKIGFQETRSVSTFSKIALVPVADKFVWLRLHRTVICLTKYETSVRNESKITHYFIPDHFFNIRLTLL